MVKRLVILLLPVVFAGCSVGHLKPMTLGPSGSSEPTSCLTYSNTPSYGDCKAPDAVSVPQRTQ